MDRGIGWWLTKHAVNSTDRVALVAGDARRTYGELNARADQLCSALYAAGVRRGDRVSVLTLNGIEMLETLFATAKLGAIWVPNNYRLSAAEVAYNLSDSGAVVLVHSRELADLAAGALADPGVRVRHVVGIGGALPGGVEYEDFLATGSPEPRDDDVRPEDPALIMYTSGTTGRPKGAVISHATIQTNTIHAATMGGGLSRDDVTTTPAPVFHIGGLMVHTLPLLYLGGKVVLLEAFEPRGTLKAMADEGTTVQFLVPAMWHAITQVPDFTSFDLSRLRFCLSGGAPCPLTVIEFLQGQGWQFLEGFGMTETCANTMALNAEDAVRKRGAVGRPLMHAEARVVDDEDHEVPVGTVGELVMRGPSMFTGYWGLPAATAEAWRSGWFHSGDLAQVDEEGFYRLVDRKKDMVITGGENVYPIEVEQVLFRHPAVADVAVIGVPDERWGETVVAVVVPRADAELDPAELIAWTRERLAKFKCPTRVEVVAELPRTATGKVLKRDLRVTFTGLRAERHPMTLELGWNVGYWAGRPPGGVLEALPRLQAAGIGSLWTAESYGSDAVAPLAWWGSQTTGLRLGTAVMQVAARTPTATAMAALTLDHLSGGRFALGLGVSGPQVVEGWYGQSFAQPLARTREYVRIVRDVLERAAPVTSDGPHYPLPLPGGTGLGKPLKANVRPLRPDVPVLLAAEGPKNVALAGEIADGWLPFLFSPDHEHLYREPVEEGLARPGARRTAADFEVVATVPVSLGDDRDAAAAPLRSMLALYVGGMGARSANFHHDVMCRMGFEEPADEVRALYLEGRKDDAAAAVPMELVDALGLVGTREDVKAGLRKWSSSMVTTLLVGGPPDDLLLVAELVRELEQEAAGVAS